MAKEITIELSEEIINSYIERFKTAECLKEQVLEDVFSHKTNNNLESVLKKVTLLNSFYSTQLFNNSASNVGKKHQADIVSMARHIADEEEFDKWLSSDDWKENLKAVNYIAFDSSDHIQRDVIHASLSFASKYCSWHYPEKYPIIDSISKGMLYYINRSKELVEEKVTRDSLNNYKLFCDLFDALKHQLDDRYSVKELDMFLWQYGKDNNII